MYYYRHKGANLVSLVPLEGFGPEISPVTEGRLFAPVAGDPVLGRGSFKVSHPGQLANPHGLEGWTPPVCPLSRWTKPPPPPLPRAASPPSI